MTVAVLKRIRKQKGFYTQDTLALATGITRQSVGAYEKGKRKAKKPYTLAIAYVLETKVEKLFKDDGQATTEEI